MSKLTDFLKLHIWEIPKDNNEKFDYVKSIAENFEKVDTGLKNAVEKFTEPLSYKGQVSTIQDLPTTATTGDIYNVTSENKNYIYNGTNWVEYSSTLDLTYLENNTKTTLTTEVSEALTIIDCAGVGAKLDIKSGKSEQATRSGKNKLIYPFVDTTKTVNGITFTDNGDGTVTANGTSTGIVYFNLSKPTLKAGTYILNGIPAGASTSSYFIKFGNINYTNTTNTINISEDFTPTESYIKISSGVTVNNLIFKPMISIEGGDFEPYGVSPSPDYPSRIRNVGDNINLIYPFTSDYYTTETGNTEISSDVVNNGDGTYTFIGGGGSSYRIKCTQKIKAKENDSFTFNFKKISGGDLRLVIRAYKSDDTVISTSVNGFEYNNAYKGYYTDNPFNKQFICPAETAYISYDLMARTETPTIVSDIKFERGSKASPYTPYNCGSADFKVENIKNYLDWNKFIVASNWIEGSSSGYKGFKIDGLKPNTVYTLCRTDNEGLGKGTYAGFNKYNNNTNMFIHNTSQENNKQSISATSSPEGILYIIYYESMVLSSFINIIKECWIIEGNSFIQKKEQIISFPFTEGQVLHKGDYLAEDGIHQKKKTVILDGTENWFAYTAEDITKYTYYIILSDTKIGLQTSKCSHFKNVNYSWQNNIGKVGYYSDHQSINRKYFVSDKATLEEWKSYLAEQYTNGTPVTIEYELAEEIVIPYTEEQKEAYYELQHLLMYEGYTQITCIDEIKPDIQGTYYFNNELNNMYISRIDSLEEKIRLLEKAVSFQTSEVSE